MNAEVERKGACAVAEAKRAPWIKGERILGSLREFAGDRLAFLDRCAREGDVVGFRLGSRTFHLVSHPEGVKRILVDNYPNYRKATRGVDLLREVIGNGLITSEGEAWRRQRRLAQPAFHKERMASFVPIMTDATRSLLDGWEPRAARGETVDVADAMSRLTLSIVGRALMGTDLADRATTVGEALTVVLDEIKERTTSVLDVLIGTSLPTPRNRRYKRAIADLDAVVAATIAERRGAAGDEREDLLAILMRARDDESGEGMDDRLLRDQVLTMILAGHETTANALAWTWFLLSRNPAVERRVRAEVDEVLEGRAPRAEDLPRLRWVRAAVEESMRLYPPVWTLARAAAEDDAILGFAIPRGTYVFASPWVTHRHPAFWPNPEGFDPERFLADAPDRPRFAYFPFGGGARQCIGNTFALIEAQLILAMTLQRFRLDLEPGQRIEPEPLMTLRPRHGLLMKLVARPALASVPPRT